MLRIPSALEGSQVSSIWFVPESPRWLVKFDAYYGSLVYNFWLYFETVFCHFFIVETRNCTLEAAAIMTARFNSPNFFLRIFDRRHGSLS
ncbi:hypothetical protein BDR06DRAFT_567091 [Suillus hirtellus]|nr:hypothetical protein BDR06DRAFT_567091 [Suillus hirtellus]